MADQPVLTSPDAKAAVASALASARSMIGKNEVPNHQELMDYLHGGGEDLDPHKSAWCAAFVSAALTRAGIPIPQKVASDLGPGPGIAVGSYRTWGDPVNPRDVQPGDLLIANNTSHMGFANGPMRMGPNGPEVELIAGNETDTSGQYTPGSFTTPEGIVKPRAQVGMVGDRYVPVNQYSIRRYNPNTAPPTVSPSGEVVSSGASAQPGATAPPRPAQGTTLTSTPLSPTAGATPNTSSIIDTLSRNIASIESGGSKNPYAVLGPNVVATSSHPAGNAIGKYQVMSYNVGPWTKLALGQEMTPDQFRANPSAQEAVFRDQMERTLSQYSPANAASIWFTGKPLAEAGGGAKDVLGTTNASYIARATAGIPNAGIAPTAMAATSPATASGAPSPTSSPGASTPGAAPVPLAPGTTLSTPPPATTATTATAAPSPAAAPGAPAGATPGTTPGTTLTSTPAAPAGGVAAIGQALGLSPQAAGGFQTGLSNLSQGFGGPALQEQKPGQAGQAGQQQQAPPLEIRPSPPVGDLPIARNVPGPMGVEQQARMRLQPLVSQQQPFTGAPPGFNPWIDPKFGTPYGPSVPGTTLGSMGPATQMLAMSSSPEMMYGYSPSWMQQTPGFSLGGYNG